MLFPPQGQERAKKKLEQTETNHTSTIKLLIHITKPHSNVIKFRLNEIHNKTDTVQLFSLSCLNLYLEQLQNIHSCT